MKKSLIMLKLYYTIQLYLIILIFRFAVSGYIVYNLSFLTLIPVMMWPKEDGGFWLCKEGDRDIGN